MLNRFLDRFRETEESVDEVGVLSVGALEVDEDIVKLQQLLGRTQAELFSLSDQCFNMLREISIIQTEASDARASEDEEDPV